MRRRGGELAGKRLGGGGQRPVPGVEVLAFLLLPFQALEQVAVHRHDLLRLGDEGIDALLQRVPRARRQLRFREIVTLLAQRRQEGALVAAAHGLPPLGSGDRECRRSSRGPCVSRTSAPESSPVAGTAPSGTLG